MTYIGLAQIAGECYIIVGFASYLIPVLGQKGSGESGYLGAPAAVASGVNDALRSLGITVNSLPMKAARLGDLIAAALGKK